MGHQKLVGLHVQPGQQRARSHSLSMPRRVGSGPALGAVLLSLSALSAHAQNENTAPANVAAEAVELDPVTVTARLRAESEQRVPVSMAVVSGEALVDEGRFTLSDLDSRVANLQIGDLNGTPTIFLRGVGGGGRQVGFEPRTGLYIDGVFMNQPPLADALLLDLDRVEVLRGPQAACSGRTTSLARSASSRASRVSSPRCRRWCGWMTVASGALAQHRTCPSSTSACCCD